MRVIIIVTWMIYFNDNCQSYDKLVTTTFCYFYKHFINILIESFTFLIYRWYIQKCKIWILFIIRIRRINCLNNTILEKSQWSAKFTQKQQFVAIPLYTHTFICKRRTWKVPTVAKHEYNSRLWALKTKTTYWL